MEIKIKYLADIDPIECIKQGDMIDLRCAETTELKEGEYKQIPLGVSMKLPEGYFAVVLPRSSTFKKYGILMANSMGVIDNSYCGDNDEWAFVALAVRDTVIQKNERICQFMIVPQQPKLDLIEVSHLSDKNRGGFGSTGRV